MYLLFHTNHLQAHCFSNLDYIPAELYVKQYVRPKYILPLSDTGTTIITASLPGRMMDKCMAGEGLLAHIVVA